MKKSLRVNLTFSEATHPEWFAFLSRIHSGHVRAELVRAHLKNPGEVNLFAPEKKPDKMNSDGKDLAQPGRPDNPPMQRPDVEEPSREKPANHAEKAPEIRTGQDVNSSIDKNNEETLANVLIRSGSAHRW